MGVRAYDYNKAKSVKALSLNGKNQSSIAEKNNENSCGKIALINKVNKSYFIT